MDQERDIQLTFDELVAISKSEPQWVVSLIEEEVIQVNGDPLQARFSGFHLTQVRRARRISRDFEASIPATALILQLLDELESLRKVAK